MKYAYYGFGMLLFGSIGLVFIVMMQSVAINNDSEYYDLKEAMRAAMLESVDYECYRNNVKSEGCGYTLKISEQKFVENFTRRFAATVGGDAAGYTLEFYDVIESPPKASVVIKGNTNNYGIVSQGESLTLTNSLSGILELKIGIKEKYGYREPVFISEINENEIGDIPKNEAQKDSGGKSDIDVEADDEFCHENKGNVDLGCAPETSDSLAEAIDDDSVGDNSGSSDGTNSEKQDGNEQNVDVQNGNEQDDNIN